MEEQEVRMEQVKQAIMKQAEEVVTSFVAHIEEKRTKMNEEMQAFLGEINVQLAQLEPQEEELRNFSVGLGELIKGFKFQS